jgi:hypothetical protein
MLKFALSGNYVNFGVFRLYGDEALDDALNMFVKLVLSIQQNDLMVCFNCLMTRVCFHCLFELALPKVVSSLF